MAWSTPTNTTVGQVVTSAFWNAQIKENLAAIVENDSTNWSAWTPTTLNNITVGNGTVTARYQFIAGVISFYFRFNLGSTSAITGAPTIQLPSTVSSSYTVNVDMIGVGNVRAAGTAYPAWCQITATTAVRPVVALATGTYGTLTAISGSVPGTFTTGDSISLSGVYEAS